ncbi:LTA synthase family protein [Lachnospiraceae bacterium MD1]|uniref:LTA synthase family protein n=1 Tax=Variimorphobacter saccharofermentans TaxID=2755051 RepID=A0A839K339_9FIRM|nr:LTA synthase family protein [Variimorphobacter saccharofermentans]MBB2184040.1 LTA synthase family protein [Variimorphobacter saccharofermentans]
MYGELEDPRLWSRLKKKWINYIVLWISPVISFLMVEIMVGNYNLEMYRKYSIYNLAWYYALYLLIFSIIRHYTITILLCDIFVYIVATINYLVFLFRGNPIIPTDLLAWETGMSVASNYEISISKGFLIATVLMAIQLTIGCMLSKDERKPSLLNRFAVMGTSAAIIGVIVFTFFHTDLIQKKIQLIDFFAPKYTYNTYGTVFGFVANIKAMETKNPEGYSIEEVRDAFLDIEESQSSSKEHPNIIVIMNEAYADINMIGNFPTNIDYFPFTKKLEENTTKGTLYVSVFGGATSDTEYEFLTGNSMAVMPQNSVPYQQFITGPTDSLASILKQQGYYNIAIHPYAPSGYKRDIVYPLLGFDEFLSMKDFDNPRYIRSYISDLDSYQKIIEQYEERKSSNQPLFIFNVTMQNHGGYSSDRIFDEKDTVLLKNTDRYPVAEQYLSLLRESDKAFEHLVRYFSKEKEHTVILLFGDHQPVAFSRIHDDINSGSKITELERFRRKYCVPFVLWANYDIPEDDIDQISANYLAAYLLKTVGINGSEYQQYLMNLYEEIPVINALFYIDKYNQIHKFSEMNEFTKVINEYRYVGYNNALDKKNRLKEYYSLR